MSREPSLLRDVFRGAAAGAAGTTALNVVTYLDVVGRARPPSETPEKTVEAIAQKAHVGVPGDEDTRKNRTVGLGALIGLAAGVGTGAALGVARGLGWRPSIATGALTATLVALLAGNAPMTLLGVTDPREWAAADWAADILPHVGYGIVTACVLAAEQP